MRIVPQTILDLKWSFLPPSQGQKQILTLTLCFMSTKRIHLSNCMQKQLPNFLRKLLFFCIEIHISGSCIGTSLPNCYWKSFVQLKTNTSNYVWIQNLLFSSMLSFTLFLKQESDEMIWYDFRKYHIGSVCFHQLHYLLIPFYQNHQNSSLFVELASNKDIIVSSNVILCDIKLYNPMLIHKAMLLRYY